MTTSKWDQFHVISRLRQQGGELSRVLEWDRAIVLPVDDADLEVRVLAEGREEWIAPIGQVPSYPDKL